MCEIGILSDQRTDLVKTVYYKLCYMIECYLFLALIFPFPPPQGTGSWQTATRHSSTLQPAPSASSPPTPLSCSTCPTLPAPEIRGWGGGEGQGLEKQFLFKKYVKFKKIKNKVISGSLATLNLLQPVGRRRGFKDRVGVGACVGVLKENTIAFYLGFLFCFVFELVPAVPVCFFYSCCCSSAHSQNSWRYQGPFSSRMLSSFVRYEKRLWQSKDNPWRNFLLSWFWLCRVECLLCRRSFISHSASCQPQEELIPQKDVALVQNGRWEQCFQLARS